MANHMPYGITKCYLPPSRGDFPAFTPAKAGAQLSDHGEIQGWVDLVVVISQDSLPAKDGHLYQKNNQAVSWPRTEPATESHESDVLTPLRHFKSVILLLLCYSLWWKCKNYPKMSWNMWCFVDGYPAVICILHSYPYIHTQSCS